MIAEVLRVLRGRKKLVAGVTLLIVGLVAVFAALSGSTGGSMALVKEAWRAAFGLERGDGLVADVVLGSSSTIDRDISLEDALNADEFAWPSLLIEEESVRSGSGVSVGSGEPLGPPVIIDEKGRVVAADYASIVSQGCGFGGAGQGSPGVVLNEVAWMGSTAGPNDEWLELANISGGSVNLAGWQVLNQSGSIKITFEEGIVLPQDGFYLLRRSAMDSPIETEYSGALRNTGDHLKIFDDGCRVVDEVDALAGWPAGDNSLKKTMERNADGSGWHDSEAVGGSPREKNSTPPEPAREENEDENENEKTNDENKKKIAEGNEDKIEEDGEQEPEQDPENDVEENSSSTEPTTTSTTNSPGHLLIAEIQITGGAGSSTEDYVRIYNPGEEDVDVSGWKLRKRSKTGTESSVRVFGEGSLISAGGYFIWASSANGFADAIGADASSTQSLANDNSVALLKADNDLVDAVAWGTDHSEPFAEGQAYPENPEEGQVLRRKSAENGLQDTDDNATDFELFSP